MEQQDRSALSGTARFGYNGMLKDNDLKGEGNSYTTEFRGYDPRTARWMSIDPIFKAYESPFVGFGNNPILYNDPSGADETKIISQTETGSAERVNNHKFSR